MVKRLKDFFGNNMFASGGIFIFSNLLANFFNLLYNAYLGRVLRVEDFGLITFINTLLLLSGIFINAVGTSVSHRVAFLVSRVNKSAGWTFVKKIQNKVFILSLILTIAWVLLIPLSAKFFNVHDLRSLLFFTPVFILFLNGILFRGYLSGTLYLSLVSIAILAEAISKLLFAVVLTNLGFAEFAYLSIPLSLIVSFVLVFTFAQIKSKNISTLQKSYAFPRRFFTAAVINGLSTSGFLTLDLLLVKHYLLPSAAGEYALLSLAGKIIFFLGSLFNSLILIFVSRDIGAGRDANKTFYKLLWGTIIVTFVGFVGVGIFGSTFMPLLFGEKALAIVPYLKTYSLAISLFTLSSAYVIYHLARHHYSFSVLTLVSSTLMIIGIYFFHQDIGQIVEVVLAVSWINFISVLVLHFLKRNGKFIFRALLDLVDVFKKIEYSSKKNSGRILIFNWRDTKHKYAGGAEVYIHELAKRWVKMGYQVTLFCGSDGESARNEVVDGVQVIRRGGFYFVYFWAFVYYVLKFRGKYDVIIDTENGIPFFTPLYAKESIFCLMFHVHQEVFRKSLAFPLANFASVLENRLMPWVYKNIKFITISESSKKEIEKWDLGKRGIEIVYPGVDLETYQPTNKKNSKPLIIYIGRLQLYKSVDVFIKSLKSVLKEIPKAEVVIAGDGEEKNNLKKLTEKLGLENKISFLGRISEEEKIRLYQKAWVAVNPSLKEGWGITTIEANACGTPVVASNVPGLKDSVNNPSTGYLVEYGNIKGFAEKIVKLITDNSLRESMQEKSIQWARNFEWHESAQKGLRVIV